MTTEWLNEIRLYELIIFFSIIIIIIIIGLFYVTLQLDMYACIYIIFRCNKTEGGNNLQVSCIFIT